MATGSNAPDTFSLSSDQVFDRNCSVCEEDSTINEAVCYCTMCCMYYCIQCQSFHTKLHRNHGDKMLDKEAMLTSAPQNSARAALTTMCEEHEKLVEMYCEDHDVVCCTVCVAIYHKTCEHTVYIPKFAASHSKSKDISDVKSELQAIRDDMLAAWTSLKDGQRRMKEEKEQVLTGVKDFRRKVNETFDRLEETVVKGAETRYEDFGENIQIDLDQCETEMIKIERTLQRLESTDINNEAELFVQVKQGEERIDAWAELNDQIKHHLEDSEIKFILDDDIEEYLENIETLGEFADEIGESCQLRPIDKQKFVTVQMKEDGPGTCTIWGSCPLPDGGALITDYGNDVLKRLNTSDQVISRLRIEGPVGVCFIESSNEAAISGYDGITIVSLGSDMKVVRSIYMEAKCFGIAYTQEDLLLVTEEEGNVLNVLEYATGRHVRTVDTDQDGQDLFANTQHIAVNKDGSQIWVADLDKGLVVLDTEYNLIQVVKAEDVEQPRASCFDKEENVFVACGNETYTAVLQLRNDGEVIGTLLDEDELPVYPMAVCCAGSRLLVSMYYGQNIKVVHFE